MIIRIMFQTVDGLIPAWMSVVELEWAWLSVVECGWVWVSVGECDFREFFGGTKFISKRDSSNFPCSAPLFHSKYRCACLCIILLCAWYMFRPGIYLDQHLQPSMCTYLKQHPTRRSDGCQWFSKPNEVSWVTFCETNLFDLHVLDIIRPLLHKGI